MFLFILLRLFFFFFFNDTATTEIYTLSLHDALPISWPSCSARCSPSCRWSRPWRSEEHTSELQSRRDLVCRLLLEKKKKNNNTRHKKTNKSNNTQSTQIKNNR